VPGCRRQAWKRLGDQHQVARLAVVDVRRSDPSQRRARACRLEERGDVLRSLHPHRRGEQRAGLALVKPERQQAPARPEPPGERRLLAR